MSKITNITQWLDKKGTGLMRHSGPEALSVVATQTPKMYYKSSDGSSTTLGSAIDYDIVSGKIDVIVPLAARSDAAGFARMQGLQYGKKELIRRRLLEKLAKRKGLSVD